ncbi:hypothetical protein [Planomonospora sp. ID82291]|uniref:hypothetical protein n=1 Tax=Planomonospora sp. ID82291 TaxID=2738136 RepID=UPI001E42D412|nr:hypothetical protein [Planomonospora sp. ID82291]
MLCDARRCSAGFQRRYLASIRFAECGGPLADHTEGFARQLAEATERGLIPDPDAVRAIWDDAAAAPG